MNRTTAKFKMLLSPRWLFLRVLVAVFLLEMAVHFFVLRVEKLVPGGFPQELFDSATLSLILAPLLWWWIVRPLGSAAMREKMLAANIINTSQDAIITIDDRGRITAFNPAAERLFGYAEEEAIGQNVKMLMPPPERGAARRAPRSVSPHRREKSHRHPARVGRPAQGWRHVPDLPLVERTARG